jgi:histidyl-tRNA synthetase
MPGVGISIGLSRLFAQLRDRGWFENKPKTISEILILPLVSDLTEPIKLSNDLRRRGIKSEIFLENQSIKKKFNYADKKGVEYVVIIGDDEIASKKYTIKNMKSGEQTILDKDEVVNLISSVRNKNI